MNRAEMLKNWDDELNPDGWMIMRYSCKECGHHELIWNARPHVTPFGGVPCCKCTGNMSHTNWESDCSLINHFPEKGDLIFIDTPPELALLYARRMIRDHPECPHTADELALVTLGNGHEPVVMRLLS